MKANCEDCNTEMGQLTEFEVRGRGSLCLCYDCLHERGNELWVEIKSLISTRVGSTFEELRQDRLVAIQHKFSYTYAVLMDGFLLEHEREG